MTRARHTFAALLLACAPALAQDKLAPPHEAATQPRSDRPLAARLDGEPDEHIALLRRYLIGTFASREGEGRPALLLRSAPVHIEGMSDATLVEIARADSPADPFRLYVLLAYRRQGSLRLRTLELPAGSHLRNALASLAGAPDCLPKLDPATLSPSLDMPVRVHAPPQEASSFEASTEHPFPTNREGAIEMTASLRAGPGGLQLTDAGFDADGKRVWGAPESSPTSFDRADSLPLVRREEGLVAITTIPPASNSPKLEPNGEVVFHYTSWLTSGLVIETSRAPGHEPAKVRIPGNILPGLNKGLAGIAKGERRKIIIPPELAYGDQGRPPIPPNATLIFDVECLHIVNAPSPHTPPTTFNPHSAPGTSAPPPAPADPNVPIGSPPTNGGPETPRGGH